MWLGSARRDAFVGPLATSLMRCNREPAHKGCRENAENSNCHPPSPKLSCSAPIAPLRSGASPAPRGLSRLPGQGAAWPETVGWRRRRRRRRRRHSESAQQPKGVTSQRGHSTAHITAAASGDVGPEVSWARHALRWGNSGGALRRDPGGGSAHCALHTQAVRPRTRVQSIPRSRAVHPYLSCRPT